MKWPLDEISKIIFENSNSTQKYGIAVIDIDYIIRFCLRFTQQDVNGILQDIEIFLKEKLTDARVWKSNGDEFLILIPYITKEAAFKLLEDTRRQLKKKRFTIYTEEDVLSLTVSFSAGVAAFPEDGNTIEEVIRKATVALFLAKAFRRNRVFTAPDPPLPGKNRVFALPDGVIQVLMGKYGQTGSIDSAVKVSEALFWEPQAIDIDNRGHLYIVDQNNHTVLKYDGNHVYRVAGNGTFGYAGDGGPAVLAKLNKPTGLAIYQNTLYITDTGNDAVRAVDLDSFTIYTIAGTGEAGFSGDGGIATASALNKPGGAAVDFEGALYINDIANNVIRKVDKEGIISTYAGNGEYGCEEDCLAVNASFAEIYGISAHKKTSDIYIADYFNHCIKAVDYQSGRVARVAGTGKRGYSGDGGDPLHACLDRPVAVVSDVHGNLFIAESGNHCIRVVMERTGKIHTLAGDGVYGIGESGPVSGFRFANPNGLAVDENFNLYILDGANNRICLMNYRGLGIVQE